MGQVSPCGAPSSLVPLANTRQACSPTAETPEVAAEVAELFRVEPSLFPLKLTVSFAKVTKSRGDSVKLFLRANEELLRADCHMFRCSFSLLPKYFGGKKQV